MYISYNFYFRLNKFSDLTNAENLTVFSHFLIKKIYFMRTLENKLFDPPKYYLLNIIIQKTKCTLF